MPLLQTQPIGFLKHQNLGRTLAEQEENVMTQSGKSKSFRRAGTVKFHLL